MTAGVLDAVRQACAAVMARARAVSIDEDSLAALAASLRDDPAPRSTPDPAHRPLGEGEAALAFVVTLDALNFGSGWFPLLAKRDGRSGYFTIATHLSEQFDREGPWEAKRLRELRPEDCARVFGQQGAPPEIGELMALFARSLNDLGHFLEARHGGRFTSLVESADRSAARLVEELAGMPLYRDVAHYAGAPVPFYKRAQLTAADLASAFDGRGAGEFHDLDRLTAFADNLVPHVLRREGVLRYSPGLARRIEAGVLLPPGSPEEVEIRAAAVVGVERCVAALRAAGRDATAQQIDQRLWNRGQRPDMKAHPRHRTRTPYY